MDSFTLNKVEFDAVRRILGEFCGTSLGKELTRHISPSRNPEVIHKWLAQVNQMILAIRDVSLPPLGGLTDITAALERATPGGGAGGEDFAAIASSLEAAGNIRAWLTALPPDMGELHELGQGVGDFAGELAAIRSIVDATGRVMDEASHRLGEVRRQIEETGRRIHDVIYGYLRDPDVAKLLQNVTVQLHGDRYVLPVRQEHRGRLGGVVHRESNSGATAFVEPAACVEMNNLLSDLCQDERNEVQRLLNQLAIRVGARKEDIAATLRLLAQVDLVAAKAQYAHQNQMTCPELLERGPVVLAQARHPLLIEQVNRQERAGVPPEKRHTVVPIDVRLGQDFDMLVVTGSNTGGKTVALKTMAMMVLMAQSGMHIPAQRGSVMPIFRDVFIDIGDEQSLQQSLSTFGGHMKRVRYILSKVDKQCLVLLDELGAGTDPDEGGAIGQAVLDELGRVGCLGMVTTHLSVLKAYAFGNARVDNASVEFDTATMTPTYHLLIGQPGESHAIAVAQRLGLPKRLIAEARKHLGSQGKQFRRAIQSTMAVRATAEEARAQAQAAQLSALSQQEVYQAKLADLHRLQGEFETWLATLGELKCGDEVLVPSMNRKGTLARLELHRQIALVDVDAMQVEVPLKDLMPDLGQNAVREDIAALRQQILQQARDAEASRMEAQRIHDEYHRSLGQQKERARQFDTWLGAIARLKIGDEVPIARKPGKGNVVKVDLPGMKVTVATTEGELDLCIQDVFPQTGPFAHLPQPQSYAPQHGRPQQVRPRRGQQAQGQRGTPGGGEQRDGQRVAQQGQPQQGQAPGRGQRPGQGQQGRPPQQGQRPPRQQQPEPDGPMHRVSPESRAAEQNRQVLLALKPGEKVFVIPFNKRATLIRLNADKGQAVVQSGIFEMELPISDLEPIHEPPPPPKPHKEHKAETPKAEQAPSATPEPVAPAEPPPAGQSQDPPTAQP